ncbi:hypothetical protein ACOSQ3_004071 [Xanthoceras sorbifolium]
MTAFKAILLSSFAHSRSSILRNGVSSLSKHFTTSYPRSIISKDEARLREFLHGKCKTGKIDLHEALYFFDYMIHIQPTPPMYSFNVLFTALVKNRHYGDVISLHIRMNSVGLVPNLITSNILINCFCKMGRVGDGFLVFGSLLRRGFNPSDVTFNCLIKGFCRRVELWKPLGFLRKWLPLAVGLM